MKKFLNNLVEQLGGMDIETINIEESTDAYVKYAAMSKDGRVYIYGQTHNPVECVKGSFSLGSYDIASNIIKQSSFKNDDVTILPKYSSDGRLDEMTFVNIAGKGSVVSYRLAPIVKKISKKPIEKYDVVIKDPSMEKIDELKTISGIIGKVEQKFTPKVEKGNLILNFGDNSNHHAYITLSENVEGNINNSASWYVDKFVSALKHSKNGSCDVKFKAEGLLEIEIDDGYSKVSYMFPGCD